MKICMPAWLSFALILSFAVACDFFADKKDTAGDTLHARGTRSLGNDLASQKTRQLHPFVKCLNTASVKVANARAHYDGWVSPSGPTCKESKVSGISRIWLLPTNRCLIDIKRGARLMPKNEQLLQATGHYVGAFKQLSRLSETLSPYYDNQEYRKDNCALGKKLHQKLRSSFETFTTADTNIREVVDTETIVLKEAMLEDHRKHFGETKYYYARKLMLDAKVLMRTLDQEIARKRVRQPRLQKANRDFRRTYSGYRSTLKKPSKTSKGPQIEDIGEFKETVRRFYRKARKMDEVKQWKSNPDAETFYQELVTEYNFLVEQSNHLRIKD